MSDDYIEKSVEIMKSYNPRVNYREIEITPTEIFNKATAHWNTDLNIDSVIECFFDGINLNTVIYDYAFDLIEKYRSNGYLIACLTDLPSGMPDYIFKKPLQTLINKLDLYVSSQSCGYRKPNKYGLQYIADYFDTDVKSLLFIGDEQKDKITAQNAECEFMFIGDLVCQR
ncbi:MAG: HAD family hydrolase [Eubacterium sp.]